VKVAGLSSAVGRFDGGVSQPAPVQAEGRPRLPGNARRGGWVARRATHGLLPVFLAAVRHRKSKSAVGAA